MAGPARFGAGLRAWQCGQPAASAAGNLRKTDLSELALRQVYLQGVDAQDASIAGAFLDGAVLDEAFAYPTAVALSADGTFLVAGTPTSDVRLRRGLERTLLLTAQGHTAMVWCVAV